MANDLVVTLGARLDQFAADLDQAGNMADGAVSKIEKSFAGLNPGINLAGLGALAAGAVAGFGALMAIVTSLNNGLAEMAKQADRVGLSYERFQQLKFGAAAIGIGDRNFGADMEAFTLNAQKALSTGNDLKRVFEANGVAITDNNGKLKQTNVLFEAAVDIIKRAPRLGDAMQIGSFLGVSKEFSQAIYESGDAFLKLASTANSVGAVIDDATIEKSKKFTTEWNRASAVWGAQMKAATLEFLPLINDAIAAAGTLISYVSTVTGALRAIKEFGTGGPDLATASLDTLEKRLDDLVKIQDKLTDPERRVGKMLSEDVMVKKNPLTPIESFQLANIPKEDVEHTAEDVEKEIAKVVAAIANFNANGPKIRVGVETPKPSINPGIKQPEGAESFYDRQNEQIEKHIALTQADTAAVGEGVGERERLRTEAALYAALLRDGVTDTEKFAEAIADMAERSGEAAKQLAMVRHKSAELASAYQTVGSAVSTAFADAIIEGKKLDEVLKSLVNTLLRAAINKTISNVFDILSPVKKFAGGTDSAPGGMAVVGERGPELVNLPRGSQVIPNDVLRQGTSGGAIVYSPAIDARGASVEAVARLAQVMEADRAAFATRTVATIQQARRARVPGV